MKIECQHTKLFESLIYLIYIFFTISGMALIKMGSKKRTSLFSIFSFPISLETLCGIFLYGCSFLLYLFVIQRSQLSLVMPVISGINLILIVILGIILFKESICVGQIVGIITIILGIIILGLFSK